MTELREPPRFVAISGPLAGQVFQLEADEATIGRDSANPLAMSDPSLSRTHCALVREAGGWVVRDLGSFNGTFVNGEQIAERLINDGDRLTIGDTELLFRAGRDTRGVARETDGDSHQTTRLRLEDAIYLHGAAAPSSGPADGHRLQRDLQALVRIGTLINRIRDRESLERELLNAAFEMVPAGEAALLRLDAATADRQVVCTRTRDNHPETPPSRTAIDLVLSTGDAILSNTVMDDSALKHAPSLANAHVTSILAVPLLDDARVGGLIYLVASDQQAAFDTFDLEVVTALAGIGAIALKNVNRLESLEKETQRLKEDLGIAHEMKGLRSTAMHQVCRFIGKVAPTDATVLIRGETGTGKELAARALHANSKRAARPFVAINCAALTETLLETELFGHERGAFTDARATKQGKLEVADRGTVFLDEVGELAPSLQSKLLRVLQQREFERVGGTRPIKVDIRLVSATNRDLQKEIAEGRFREDLYFRLNVVTLDMPPLRQRREDILELAEHFAARVAPRCGRRSVSLSPSAMRCLLAYDWPGNVRELENAIERAIVLSDAPEIGPEDLPEALVESSATAETVDASSFHAAVANTKKRVILEAIDKAEGRLTEAARLLGLHPNYLHRLIRNLKLRTASRRRVPNEKDLQ